MKFNVFIGLLILNFSFTFAQIEITGVVFDDEIKLPVVGANIIEINTSNGVISDYSGRFKLTVNDTSKVRVSFIGYVDCIINPQDFQNDTVRLYSDPAILISLNHHYYANTYHIGYYGDLKKMPYGFTAYYFRPYLFRKSILLSTQLLYKTDFASNYDFKLSLTRSEIVKFRKYRLSSSIFYQKRESNSLLIKDYDLLLNNYILNSFTLITGFGIKEDFSGEYRMDNGVILGLGKYFGKTMTYIRGDISRYRSYSEYELLILQRFSDYKRFWSKLKFGVNYQYYNDYAEFNFILRYSNSH